MKAKQNRKLKDLGALERHFRLAKVYDTRNKAIHDDFTGKGGLGNEWIRLIHDAKNPLVIGLGGTDGAMTTEQKRRLGIVSCVGAMVEYADINGGKKARKAVVANLSINTDKASGATLQHLMHSLQQNPLKEIFEDKMHTKVEVVHDNAANYISKEFLYGCTKGIHQFFPHIKVVR